MTDKARLLALLSDGKPHSHKEAYRLGLMAHSRAADLRADGHDIRVWREGGVYLYQLASVASTAGADDSPSAVGGAPTASGAPRDTSVPPSPGQEGARRSVPSDQLALELPARLREEAA